MDSNIYDTQNIPRTAGRMPVWGENTASKTEKNRESEFGFADLIDMINPLQHIPLVNIAYQKITGDGIKPISQIVGGAVFGGALGAGSALVNVVIEAETGKNIGEHALSLTDTPSYTPSTPPENDRPEHNLNAALVMLERMDAHSAVAFVDMHTQQPTNDMSSTRVPITDLKMRPMPPRNVF